MAKFGLTVFQPGPGERISVSIVSDGESGDISITPIEALQLADGLVRAARISLCGTKENQIPQTDPLLATVAPTLDLTAFSISEIVRALPRKE